MTDPAPGTSVDDQQKKSGGGDQPVAVTEASVNELINKALSARFRTFEEKQTKTFEGLTTKLMTDFGASLDTKLEAFKPVPDKEPHGDPKQSPEYRAQQKQIDDLKKTVTQAQQEKAVERQKARSATLRQGVEAQLKEMGVTHPHAAGYLIDSAKLVDFADENSENVIFRKKGSEDVDLLGPGLSEWLKSAEGKLYVPTSGASGSGERPGGSGGTPPRSGNGSPPAMTRHELGSALLNLSRSGG
jgi:hypothetical protein